MTILLRRFRNRILTLMLITLTALHSTIAKPLELGEGDSNSDIKAKAALIRREVEDSLASPRPFTLNPPQEFGSSQILGGSNVQINSRDEPVGDQEDQAKVDTLQTRRMPLSFSRYNSKMIENDMKELADPVRANIKDSFEFVRPKYVAKIVLSPLREEYPANDGNDSQRNIQTGIIQLNNGQEMNDEDYSRKQNDEENFVETLNIPTQDVGEQDENSPVIETMDAENSNNIAYSYSSYVPNYQIAPNSYHQAQQLNYLVDELGDHQLAPMSFVFHPTVLRSTRPNILLQELKQFAYQLEQSPIMNALFSPSTVPIPSNHPAWPSKFEAQKYLPPNRPQAIQNNPNLRRTVMQINVDDQKMFEELQQNPVNAIAQAIQDSIARNAATFSQGMSDGLNSRSSAMNQFFNNQLQVPQFPTFSSFNQYQFQGNPNQNQPFPQFSAFPYISPSLRPSVDDPRDDIDRGSSVIQIGTGNKNIVSGGSQVEVTEDDLDSKIDEISEIVNQKDEDGKGEKEDEDYGDPSKLNIVDSDLVEAMDVLPAENESIDAKNAIQQPLTNDEGEPPVDKNNSEEEITVQQSLDDGIEETTFNGFAENEATEVNDLKDEDDFSSTDGLEIMNQLKENATTMKPETKSRLSKELNETTLPTVMLNIRTLQNDEETTSKTKVKDEPTSENESSTTATFEDSTKASSDDSYSETTVPSEETTTTKCLSEDSIETTTESIPETTTLDLDVSKL